MANSLDERGRALEEGYFRQKDNELIENMRAKTGAQVNHDYACPKCAGKWHTGNFENVQIEICDGCGGVWLDAGELQQITHKQEAAGFFGRLFG